MNNSIKCFALLLSATAVSTASAQLYITEVMSNSSHGGGTANGDWWELTNTSAFDIDLTGYYWDDDGATGNDGALFPSITITAGESIVIVEESDAAAFVAAWGGGFTAYSKDDFGGPDDFSGLSAGGDQIQLWDSDPNAGAANLIAEVLDTGSQSSPNAGYSFAWDTSGNSLGRSSVGQFGAYTATSDGGTPSSLGTDVGSPGSAVPEPSTSAAIIGLLALVSAQLRRRR
jgi:hypothetical protein